MRGTYSWTSSLLATWLVAGSGGLTATLLMGCGEAPPAPTGLPTAQRVGAGSMGQTESSALPVRASSDSTMTPPASEPTATPPGAAEAPPDVEAPPAAPSGAAPPAAPSPAAQTISACREDRLAGCDAIYIRVLKSAPDICVQLVLDNCNENSRLGLGVTTPFSWKLSSGSATANKTCALDTYDPKSEPALDGSGSIRWAEEGRDISNVEFDVQLELAPPPESTLPDLVDVATERALDDIADCE